MAVENEMVSMLVTKREGPQLNFVRAKSSPLYDNDKIASVSALSEIHSSLEAITPVPTYQSHDTGKSSRTFDCSSRATTSTTASETRKSISSDIVILDVPTEGESTPNYSYEGNEKETDKLRRSNYFDFLDDYIRFDVSRTGVSCFSGYSISVQYEDDFLIGKTGMPCCLFIWSAKSYVRLWRGKRAVELEYFPRVSCIRPKNCVYHVKIPGESVEIGTIRFQNDLVQIYNAHEKCLSLRRKQGTNTYSIKTDTGDRLASIEIFRGLRGDIVYYGLSILGDASATDKALLIGLTIAMDIRQRESEMRCSLLWVPFFCVIVIGMFSILPWLYLYDNS